MRIIFMGTPEFAVPSLESLIQSSHEIAGVFTQPDRPVGRRQTMAPPPVKRLALSHHLPVFSPEKIRNEEVQSTMQRLNPDVIVVVAYGKILPPWMLRLPKQGAINGHASMLPKYRGAAPIQWAVANGETVTGVTTMQMDEGLDTGAILLQQEVPIGPEDTAQTMYDRLAGVTASLLQDTLKRLEEGTLSPQKQDDSQASFAPILKKEDGKIEWEWPAEKTHNRVRGLNPWPGTYASFRGKQLKIWKTELARGIQIQETRGEPGALVHSEGRGLLVETGAGGLLKLLEVQPEGHRRMSALDFVNGFRIKSGERLE